MSDEIPRRRRRETVPEAPRSIAKATATRVESSTFAIDVGDSAPLFILPNESSAPVPLAVLRGGPVLVCFCPGEAAVVIAAALDDQRRTLGEKGATALLLVREGAAEIAAPHGRDVVVLADGDGAVHRAYGVLDPSGQTRLAVFLLDAHGDVASVWSQSDPTLSIPLAVEALDLARGGR